MNKRSRGDSESSSSDVDMDSSENPLSSGVTSPPASMDSDHPVKYAHVDDLQSAQTVIRCSLPPHKPLKFSSYGDYDTHYEQYHLNRCSECMKNFPSEHYLGLHIADNHNPLNEVLRERGQGTYACFVEGCDYMFSHPHKRKMHAIDKHGFPKFYDFFIVNDGIDRRTSMLRPRPRSRKNSKTSSKCDETSLMVVEEGSIAEEKEGGGEAEGISALTNKMSALRFIPRGVKFGKGQRGGFRR